eukprot:3896409-Rhodomonas_salina.1
MLTPCASSDPRVRYQCTAIVLCDADLVCLRTETTPTTPSGPPATAPTPTPRSSAARSALPPFSEAVLLFMGDVLPTMQAVLLFMEAEKLLMEAVLTRQRGGAQSSHTMSGMLPRDIGSPPLLGSPMLPGHSRLSTDVM